jgi:hypothetical protein
MLRNCLEKFLIDSPFANMDETEKARFLRDKRNDIILPGSSLEAKLAVLNAEVGYLSTMRMALNPYIQHYAALNENIPDDLTVKIDWDSQVGLLLKMYQEQLPNLYANFRQIEANERYANTIKPLPQRRTLPTTVNFV